MVDITPLNQLLDREIWLVEAAHAGRRGGMISTSVNQASIVPALPRMVLGVAKQHHTWGVIEASRAFTLHLLHEAQLDLVWRFGLQSGHKVDKFAGLASIAGSIAVLECRVEATLDTGDRTVFLAEVVAARFERPGPPLTMSRLLQLAPPDRLRELRAGLEQDALVDAAAIRQWRKSQHG